MINDNSVDIVVSDCVLNLVPPDQKAKLSKEAFRPPRDTKGEHCDVTKTTADAPCCCSAAE